MKCKHCDGDGVIVDVEYGHAGKYGCKYCDGKGVVEPLTEEEYLRSCTTEQLAEAIYNFVWCSSELWQQLCCNGDGTDEESDLRIVREWLKQPHTVKE